MKGTYKTKRLNKDDVRALVITITNGPDLTDNAIRYLLQ